MSESSAGTVVYSLPKGVWYYEQATSFYLIRDYPLKSILLHPSWRPVFEFMSDNGGVSLKVIKDLIGGKDQDKIELFLNELVRKGFLEQRGFSALESYPFVSVIIPVRNRPGEIEVCLDSLGKMVYPPERLEIIVVDDASTDHTPDVISRFPARLIRLKQHKNAPYCRNLAAREAEGGILAFIDSDCLADPLWLKELLPAFKDPSLGAVGGTIASFFDRKPLDRYEAVKSSLIVSSMMKRSSEEDKSFYVPSCNLLVRKECFSACGGFKENLTVGEDVDLCWRMQDRGYQFEFRPLGKVYHRHRNRLSSFCVRRFDYGTSEPMLQKLHPRRSKKMSYPAGACLFWGGVFVALYFHLFLLYGFSALIMLLDSLKRFVFVRRRGIDIGFYGLFISTLRTYLSFLYHSCAFISRYYLVWALAIGLILPWTGAALIGAHILVGLVEYRLKKPDLNPVSFLFYFSLEQLSYQLGVWYGCFENRSFKAVFPRISVTGVFGRLTPEAR